MKRVTLLISLSLSFAIANESSYTSIADKDCKTTGVFENNMGASLSCEKFEEFEMEVIDSHARMSITIKRQGIEYPQRKYASVGAGFSTVVSSLMSCERG